jgi:hypothetical protein
MYDMFDEFVKRRLFYAQHCDIKVSCEEYIDQVSIDCFGSARALRANPSLSRDYMPA